MSVNIPHNYTPRDYQLPILDAMDSGCTRAVLVWHRRSGKDKTCINIIVKKMLERVGTYYYVFPTYNQGRKVLWDGIDKEGKRFLDHFPKEILVGKPNDTEMKLTIINGSKFQVVGSDNVDSIVGTNPIGIVFTEYSLQDPRAWDFLRPILAENGGWAIFVFTPRGENHGFDIYNLAMNDPKWFCQMLTVDDTGAIPQEVIEQELREIRQKHGNDALAQQEYWCNFTVPLAGAYYADQIIQLYKDGRVTSIPYVETFAVDTWWDLGFNDMMAIWFTQSIAAEMRLIDYAQFAGKGLPDAIRFCKEKPYVYGRHVGPHDIEVHELGTNGKTRKETAANLGFNFEVCPKISVNDGIDAARSLIKRSWFDSKKCHDGLNALKSYRKQYDEKRKTFLKTPYHDWSSNGADAFRTLAVGLHPGSVKTRDDYKNNERRAPAWQSRSMDAV